MLLGERDSLDPQTTTDFQRTGAYHVLVISGLHIGLLAFVLLRVLRLLWVPRGPAAALTVVLLAFYALLVGAGTPVLRAAWMLAAYLVTTLVYRQRQALNVIAATAFFFLVADPDLLFDPGFQLSFLAVALIAAVAVPLLDTTIEPLRMALRDIWNTDRDLHYPPAVAEHRVAIRTWLEPLAGLTGLRRTWITFPVVGGIRVLVWAAELAVVSLIIQAGLALPLVFHFQRFSGSGVSANLAIVPLLFLAVPVGLAALLTAWAPLAKIALWAAGAIGSVVEWHAGHLPLEIRVPPPPAWLAVCFGLSLVLVAVSLAGGASTPGSLGARSFGAGRRKQFLAAAVSVALLFLLVWHPFPPDLTPGRMELSILDVGQGDSIFVAFPGGQTMIVDGGGQPDFRDPADPPTRLRPIDIGELVVSPYLWSRSVKRLDVVAVTHADEDHLGGIPALLRNFEVGELWLGEATFAAEYGGIVNLARARGTSLRLIHEGQSEALGGAHIEILGPSLPPAERRNDQSLVLCLRFGQQNFLLTGDIEQGRENTLAASGWLRPSSFLKVAHHGSRSSSQPEFLRQVRPLFAIISAGSDNFYGHPHPAVIQRLAEAQATVLRTDEEGLISVATDGRRLFVDTFRRRSLRGAPAGELAVVAGR
jgi:competence protein ComEC